MKYCLFIMKIRKIFNNNKTTQANNRKLLIEYIVQKKFELVIPMLLFSETCLGDINATLDGLDKKRGERALDLAVEAQDQIAIEICMILGADAELFNEDYRTPLGKAINSELAYMNAIRLLAKERYPRRIEDVLRPYVDSATNAMIVGYQAMERKAQAANKQPKNKMPKGPVPS